jgi:hypothetical protein
MADYTQVAKIMAALAASYPTFNLQKATIDAYARLLADVDANALATAADQAAAESKFFPTIAELRERALAIRGAINGWPDAAEVFQSAVRQAGSRGYDSFDATTWPSEAIRDFVKTWWRDICYTDEDNLPTIRAQFRDSYNARARRADQRARNLPGTNDMIDRLTGQLNANTPRLGGGGR